VSDFSGLATVSRFPFRDGDGYSYGGEVIVNIDGISLIIGTGNHAEALAKEIAARWNAGAANKDTPQ
jgi:hypothetical protein